MDFDQFIALDTNEYIHAVRADADFPASQILVFEKLSLLRVSIPLQVGLELQRNLNHQEMRTVLRAMKLSRDLRWDYEAPPENRVQHWQTQGAKKGDAVICASLEDAGVKYLISENRHFLAQIENLPFAVLSAQQLLDLLFPP